MIDDNPEPRNVIFLGAGASKSEKAPLQSDLFNEYFRTHNNDVLTQNLKKFFKEFFGTSFNQEDSVCPSFPTCEEALGMLEMAISKKEGFLGDSHFRRDQLPRIRDGLVQAISLSIAKSLRDSYGHREPHHETLASRLIETHDFAIISTNYDILIDDALIEKGHTVDYGFDFRFNRTGPNVETYIRPHHGFLLYKIHGSLNWLYCPTCKAVDLTPQMKSIGGKLCDNNRHPTNCEEKMTPVLIPPTYMKDISTHFIQRVWESSEILLRSAERLIFCGYSFPDADMHFKYMLKRAEMNRQNDAPLEVFVVNYHEDKSPSDIVNEYERYSRFLKNPEHLHYTRQSFEDFCSNGLVESDVFTREEINCLKLDNSK